MKHQNKERLFGHIKKKKNQTDLNIEVKNCKQFQITQNMI